MDENDEKKVTDELYDRFLSTVDLEPTLKAFQKLCAHLDINIKNYKTVFSLLKSNLKSWKCQTLFNKLDKKSKHQDYKNKPCARLKVLIIGAGPVGLRTAIEAAFLGAHVCVVEKRDSFSRNNVLHLWPFLIVDLKSLGIKSFFGKFCAGSLDHISIRRLQCILLKMCLLLGVEIHTKTSFGDIVEPTSSHGWKASFLPQSSKLNTYEYDAIVGCDGKYNGLKFKRKEFRGKLAIAITCNFINKQTSEEARVEEISGVAFIYNQEFFQELKDTTGIELENIVYYKDETHYFVMTAKKRSLLYKNVIKQDSKDVFKLLSAENVNHNALLEYARAAADFSTKYQLPHHEFAKNHLGKEDVAMFDFTSIHQAENASRIVERRGKRLLLGIAGDVLLEPFWPTGSGCARGFLSAFDIAWMIRGLGLGRASLELLQERESIFTILPQTKPDSLLRYHDKYSIDPFTRYANLNSRVLRTEQVKHLSDMNTAPFKLGDWEEKISNKNQSKSVQVEKKTIADDECVDPKLLLRWCQKQTENYPNLRINDLDNSWKNGLGFCALINRFRPDIIDYFTLEPDDAEVNCEKAFLAAEEHFGIPPKISTHDLVKQKSPDKLALLAYISSYYEALKNESPGLIIHPDRNDISLNSYNHQNSSRKTHTYYAFTGRLKDNMLQDNMIHDSMLQDNIINISVVPSLIESTSIVSQKVTVNKDKPRNGERVNPTKSTSKASILSRLSKRTKKKKTRLSRKSGKDKDTKAVLNDSGVSLKSFDKTFESHDNSSTDVSGISSDEPSPVKKTFPNVKLREKNRFPPVDANHNDSSQPEHKSLVDYNNDKNVQATTGADKYKRISQLAESVFGDTIVQKSNSHVQKRMSTEVLTESEKCYFCGRKVYVMERQSAEGLFFHRTCFRCCVCKCQLHIGDYIFDASDDDCDFGGKFYCKVDYNRIVYKKSKPKVDVQNSPEKKKRPVTQIFDSHDIKNLHPQNEQTNVSPQNGRPVRDIQEKLRENLPGLQLRKTKSNVVDMKRAKLVERDFADGDNDEESGPYSRLSANDGLLDRHPSLLRCSPEKVTTKTFFTASKFSTSTPNLTKLIQEDSIFEEERKRQAEKLANSKKKLIPYQSDTPVQAIQKESVKSPVKKKLSVPSDLVATVYGANDTAGNDTQVYRDRYASYNVIPDETIGAVHRRPEHERRAQYPVSMAFSESVIASGLRPVVVEIDVDSVFGKQDDEEEEKAPTQGKVVKKKKRLRKKKGKKSAVSETIEEGDESKLSPIKENGQPDFPVTEPSTPSIVIDDAPNENPFPKFDRDPTPEVTKRIVAAPAFDDLTSSSSSSEDEIMEVKERKGFFRKNKPGKKKKKHMNAEEKLAQEQKEKRREKRKIRKELREREMKRLWEAQSIQRKLNEVDVKQFELEERAVQVEKQLRSENLRSNDRNDLTMEWIHLVNEKNLLLRFESELVIQCNSIQLEDRYARLDQQIRDLLTAEKPKAGARSEIDRLTKELVDIVEQRNALVEMLEEDRLREMEEDKTIKETFARKSHDLGMDRLI